jgi:hypothetical protein
MRGCAVALVVAACGSPASSPANDAVTGGDAAPPVDASEPPLADRERLLASYLAFLDAHPGPQSNGLDGAQLDDVCGLWDRLAPAGRATFLTLAARFERGRLGDGSTMLAHVRTLYKVEGGSGATATDPGSCGGAGNRWYVSIDTELHGALLAAHAQEGGPSGARVLPDGSGYWRDTHDLAGPHDPFDRSDETEDDVPRGQVHYFADPSSAVANAPLGRADLEMLVDPLLLELDHDYDCVHNSNPLCSYTLYGNLCTPRSSKKGVDLYREKYGPIDLSWRPAGC